MIRSVKEGMEELEIKSYVKTETFQEIHIEQTLCPIRINTAPLAIAAMLKGLEEFYYRPLYIEFKAPPEIQQHLDHCLAEITKLSDRIGKEKPPESTESKLILVP